MSRSNNDGIVFIFFVGFRALGFNVVSSFIFTIILHVALSYSTLPVRHSHLHLYYLPLLALAITLV